VYISPKIEGDIIIKFNNTERTTFDDGMLFEIILLTNSIYIVYHAFNFIDYTDLAQFHGSSIWFFFGSFTIFKKPLRIRVRIDPPHPLVCRKRQLNGLVLPMRPEKPRSPVTAGVAR
jgi:hypothetical protein